MARLTLHITTHNAAFDADRNGELARILHNLADNIQMADATDDQFLLFDANGNRVGRTEFTP
jgi:hypothetical protein